MADGSAVKVSARLSIPGGAELLDDGSIVFAEFEEGDPRRGPHSLDERAEAKVFIKAPKRWHRDRGVDWFAVRLQFGRGLNAVQVGRLFGIGDSTVSRRKRDEKWTSRMSERDRRKLSQLIWLGGIYRHAGDDPESRERLKAASAWDELRKPEAPKFVPMDPLGEPRQATLNQENANDDSAAEGWNEEEYADDCNRLDELVARMERDVAERRAAREAEVVPDVDKDAGGEEEVSPAEEGVAAVGEDEPDSS